MHGQQLGAPKRRICLPILALMLTFGALGITGNKSSRASEIRLNQWLKEARAEHQLIALAGLVLQNGKVVSLAAVGHRKKGNPTPVATDDLWHLGSNTKAMTATMIGRLVEQGVFGWDDPLVDLVPELAGTMHPGFRDVTLDHLLTHRAGLPANFSFFSRFNRPPIDKKLPKKRLNAVAKALTQEPLSPPGKAHLYSNVGYTLAGVVAEQATGLSWEALMQRELFAPLGIVTAGFGAPGSRNQLDQPFGHQPIFGVSKRAAVPGPWADNSSIMNPANAVNMSLRGWAKFVDAHLKGETGENSLLRADSFKRLHLQTLENYAYGWVIERESKLAPDDRMLWHNGSNTMWYTLALLWPERDTAFLFASNDGDIEAAERAMKKTAKRLAKRYLIP